MTTSFIAMGLAFLAVIGLVVGIGVLSLTVGAVDFIFGGPKINFLKTQKGENGFAFSFNWNSAKEPATMNYIQLRLYNALGGNKQIILSAEFEGENNKFAKDIDFGSKFQEIIKEAKGSSSTVEIEVGSRKDGIHYQFLMKGEKFLERIQLGIKTVDQFYKESQWNENTIAKNPIPMPTRSFIADTVPGQGNQLAIPTNPAFADLFAGSGSGGGSTEAKEEVPNFAITKVWIEPGCIVCDACEDIYPEVFEVTGDTCIIRPDAPLDNGLLVQDAAEACPVEVIKFTKAG